MTEDVAAADATMDGYLSGCRCESCIQALLDWRPVSDSATHGTLNGYRRHGCRCAPCSEANRDGARRAYAKNPDKAKARMARYRAANRDSDNERVRAYRAANRDAINARRRERRAQRNKTFINHQEN
jgi:hypothetical protein